MNIKLVNDKCSFERNIWNRGFGTKTLILNIYFKTFTKIIITT